MREEGPHIVRFRTKDGRACFFIAHTVNDAMDNVKQGVGPADIIRRSWRITHEADFSVDMASYARAQTAILEVNMGEVKSAFLGCQAA